MGPGDLGGRGSPGGNRVDLTAVHRLCGRTVDASNTDARNTDARNTDTRNTDALGPIRGEGARTTGNLRLTA